jgi:hypothetical protein
MKLDYKELSEKYRLEAEAYAAHHDDELNPLRALLVMSGVLCAMESELIQFEMNKGKTEKSKLTQERIDILKSIYDDMSNINERNRKIKLILADNNSRMMKMADELGDLKRKLEALENFEQV